MRATHPNFAIVKSSRWQQQCFITSKNKSHENQDIYRIHHLLSDQFNRIGKDVIIIKFLAPITSYPLPQKHVFSLACNFSPTFATYSVERRFENMETKNLEKEFLEMVDTQKRAIYKVCYIYAKDRDDLNDLFQETVLNLWKGFPRYRGDSKLTTWVYRIAMNTCITFLRRSNTRIQTIPITANVAGLMAEEDGTAGQLRELYKLINQLGKMERALILLWLEERSYQEMADILGISKNNVAVKINRVKEKLRKMSNN